MKALKSCTENFRFYPHSQHLPNFLRMTVLQDKQRGGSSKAGQDPVRKRALGPNTGRGVSDILQTYGTLQQTCYITWNCVFAIRFRRRCCRVSTAKVGRERDGIHPLRGAGLAARWRRAQARPQQRLAGGPHSC